MCLAFADDFKLYRIIESSVDAISLQRDLNNVTKWCGYNGLELNVNKCFSISFTRSKNHFEHTYFISGIPLKSGTTVRDLGVLFDSKLTFVPHLDNIINRGMKNLGFLNRNCAQLSPYCYKVLYCELVRSVLEYASVVWSPYYACHIDRIESVQKILKISCV